MNKKLHGILLGSVMLANPVYADDAFDLEVSANIGMVTEYIWRGWNINDELSAQGGFDLNYGNFYAGTWGGTDGNYGTEIDLYVGYAGQFNDKFSYDVGVIQYRYPKVDKNVEEWHVTVGYDFLSLSYHGGEDDYDYIEMNASFDLTDEFSLELHYGHEDNGNWTWNDYGVTLHYQINDSYRMFVAASDKENNDSHVYAGIIGEF